MKYPSGLIVTFAPDSRTPMAAQITVALDHCALELRRLSEAHPELGDVADDLLALTNRIVPIVAPITRMFGDAA